MEQDYTPALSDEPTLLGGKSWTAYFGTIVTGLFLLLVGVPVAWFSEWRTGALILAAATLVVAGYRIWVLASYKLYYDEAGVWLYSGVFPWNRGARGVKWRDLDEALYYPGFWSWLFRSYSVRIGHRFTKSGEIFAGHMARGHEAVMTVNTLLQELARAGTLS